LLTLHHLAFSRSTRVIWALEELGLPYELVTYQRTPAFRAPPELAEVHPLGKAPVLADNALRIAESAAILAHLNDRHGSGRLAPPIGSDARAVHDDWLHYVEGSAAMPIMLTLIGGMTGGLPAGLAGFVTPELAKTLAYIADAVGDGPWLLGADFTIADIHLAYLVELAGAAGMLAAHPSLAAYLQRLQARPAYAAAIAKGGPVVPPYAGGQ
jgi:glutathione S-transferase